MFARSAFVLTCLLLATPAISDSIMYDGVVHKEVIVREAQGFYYVQDPSTGATTKLSKMRSDVKNAMIETDPALRQKLQDEFERACDRKPVLATPSNTPQRRLNSSEYRLLSKTKDWMLWEARFEYWSQVPEELRTALRESINRQANAETSRLTRNVMDHQLQKSEHESSIIQSQIDENEAVQEAFEDSGADFYGDLYNMTLMRRDVQNASGNHNPYTDLTVEEYRRYTNYELGKANARAAAAAQYQASIRQYHANAINEIETNLKRIGGLGQIAVNRLQGYKRIIDALDVALENEYRPQLTLDEVFTWDGSGGDESGNFQISASLWRIDCLVADPEIAVDVLSANGAPVARVSNADFIGMRTAILDKQGEFRFCVKNRGARNPQFLVRVSALNEPEVYAPEATPSNDEDSKTLETTDHSN